MKNLHSRDLLILTFDFHHKKTLNKPSDLLKIDEEKKSFLRTILLYRERVLDRLRQCRENIFDLLKFFCRILNEKKRWTKDFFRILRDPSENGKFFFAMKIKTPKIQRKKKKKTGKTGRKIFVCVKSHDKRFSVGQTSHILCTHRNDRELSSTRQTTVARARTNKIQVE